MSIINIGIPIDLQKLLDTRMLVQAGSGGGKSYGLRKIIESIGNQVQQIVIDPEGEFVTLREKFDFALVSKGGDIPLNVKYAETLAHKILETGISVIIDLYELPQHERILFVKWFGQAMINAPKQLWHPCFIHIDEAHIFCPESSKSESTAAVIDLCTRGRKRGYCTVLATQRLPKLNKDATAECNNKMIGRSAQDIDRKRAGEELGMTSKADILAIRDLQPGNFYAFGPAISIEVIKFKVAPVLTTHLQSGRRLIAPPPIPKAIYKILTQLSSIPEEAEKELITKQQLQQEVNRLKVELSRTSKATSSAASAQDKAAIQKEVHAQYATMLKEKDATIIAYGKEVKRLQSILSKITHLAGSDQMVFDGPTVVRAEPVVIKNNTKTAPTVPRMAAGNALPLGEMKVLTACGQFPNGLRRDQFTVLTGYKRSSRDAYIQRLREKGYVDVRDNKVFATDAGVEALGSDYEPLPTGPDLQDYWLSNLPEGERKILAVLIKAYPEAVPRDTLSEKTGYMRSSRDAYIQRMSAKEIITTEGRGMVKASENLF
jgi:hypothetical protein